MESHISRRDTTMRQASNSLPWAEIKGDLYRNGSSLPEPGQRIWSDNLGQNPRIWSIPICTFGRASLATDHPGDGVTAGSREPGALPPISPSSEAAGPPPDRAELRAQGARVTQVKPRCFATTAHTLRLVLDNDGTRGIPACRWRAGTSGTRPLRQRTKVVADRSAGERAQGDEQLVVS